MSYIILAIAYIEFITVFDQATSSDLIGLEEHFGNGITEYIKIGK